jgi:hypothetical protein
MPRDGGDFGHPPNREGASHGGEALGSQDQEIGQVQ